MSSHISLHLALIFTFFFFNDTATTEIYTLSLHDALPISRRQDAAAQPGGHPNGRRRVRGRPGPRRPRGGGGSLWWPVSRRVLPEGRARVRAVGRGAAPPLGAALLCGPGRSR